MIPYQIEWKTAITGGNQNRLHNYLNITIHPKSIETFIKIGLQRFNTMTKTLPTLQRFQIQLHPRHKLPISRTNAMRRQHNLKIEPSYGKNQLQIADMHHLHHHN